MRAALERQGLWGNGAWRLDGIDLPRWPTGGKIEGKKTAFAGAFDALLTPDLVEAVTRLAGGHDLVPAVLHQQLLFTLPNADRWTVPSAISHVDAPRLPSGVCLGVQTFTFFEEVEHGGGDLPNRDRLLGSIGRAGEVEVEVVELISGPGDVWLMDMRVLHTLAPNVRSTPRVMLTQRFVLKSAFGQIVEGFALERAVTEAV